MLSHFKTALTLAYADDVLANSFPGGEAVCGILAGNMVCALRDLSLQIFARCFLRRSDPYLRLPSVALRCDAIQPHIGYNASVFHHSFKICLTPVYEYTSVWMGY